jgi:tetratricopeptide (TPR) repeat protein
MELRFQRAYVLLGQRRYADAEAELRGILSQSPSESRAHSLLAICIAEDESRYDAALYESQVAVAMEPNESLSHYSLALVQLKRKDYHAASQAIDEAIRLDPLDASFWGMRSRCDFALDRFQAMLSSARKGLELDPESIECRNLLSLGLERTGAVASSLEQAIETLRMDPDDDDSHAMLGFSLLQNGKHQEARLAFREALRLNPMNEPARSGMMQAISSRSIVFRTVHRFYSWLNRMTTQQQVFILFGGWLLMRALGAAGTNNPTIQALTLPIMIAYFMFAILTWIATPLFQTFLRFHPFGRNLLRGPEIRLSNFVAPGLVLSLVGGLVGFLIVDLLTGMGVAMYWLLATVVAVCCVRSSYSRGRLKYAVYALTAIVVLMPLWGLVESVQVGDYLPFSQKWQISMWCFVGLQVLQNVVAVRQR